MARIRSIKPEFWTSEQIANLSPIARLLFIGMWTFSDDGGRHPASLKRLKMEVFPGDSFTEEDMGGWLDELTAGGLVVVYHASGKDYWQVTGWRHQRIDRPTYLHPKPPTIDEPSTSPRRSLDEASSRTPREVDEASPPESSREESSREESSREESSREESSRKRDKSKSEGSGREPDEADLATATWMLATIKELNPNHRTPNLDRWANDIRLIRERDNRTHEEIRDLFVWANADEFWRANILSPATLRKQWDRLVITRKTQKNGNGNRKHMPGPGQRYDASLGESQKATF